MHGTTRHTRLDIRFFLYNYRDSNLLGAAKSPLCTPPITIASLDTRLPTAAVGGWKMGFGTDGIVNFDSPRGGKGPRTRRRGVGGDRRGIRDCSKKKRMRKKYKIGSTDDKGSTQGSSEKERRV